MKSISAKFKDVSIKKLSIVFAILLIASAGLTLSVFFMTRYSVVYLQTGDIYFGKFRLLPFPAMTDAWVLQRGTGGDVTLNPLSATIWKPAEEVHINPRQIVFWATLDPQSAVMRAIKSGGNAVAIPTLTPQPQTGFPTATSTK